MCYGERMPATPAIRETCVAYTCPSCLLPTPLWFMASDGRCAKCAGLAGDSPSVHLLKVGDPLPPNVTGTPPPWWVQLQGSGIFAEPAGADLVCSNLEGESLTFAFADLAKLSDPVDAIRAAFGVAEE